MGIFGTNRNDLLPFNKNYNGQVWYVQLNLINIKRGTTITLNTDNINLMIMYNDILCYSPTFELTYFDLGQTLSKILDDNNLLLKVDISQPSPNPNDPYWDKLGLLSLNLLFDIEKVTTLFKKNNNTMYRFNAIHHNKTFLLKSVNYATIKDLKDTTNTKESPLEIINKLLKKINYPTDEIVNDTTQRVNFISSQTMSVEDCIDHLLRKVISSLDPPTYFVHNIKTDKAMLINNKTLEDRLYNPCNDFNVFGVADSKNLNYELVNLVSNLTNHSFNAGLLSEKYLCEFIFRRFDQNTRKWSDTIFDYDKINNMLNKELLSLIVNVKNEEVRMSDIYESILPIKEKIDNNDMKYDFPVHNELKMYLFIREIQLGMNSISFDVVGNVTRDAGQYVNLNCSSEVQIPRYEGLWHIYSCKHVWSGKHYTNHIACYRTFHKKPLLPDKQTVAGNGV